MKRLTVFLTFCLVALCANVAHAADVPTTIVNPPGALVSMESCSVSHQSTSISGVDAYQIDVDTNSLDALNETAEVTYVYSDGRTLSQLYTLSYHWMTVQATIPTYQMPVVGTRCAVAFADVRDQHYVAPWFPLQWNRFYAVPDIPPLRSTR